MCGIAGAVGNRDRNLIEKMTEALYHRGPDSEGFFRSSNLDLGMRRLSIIDLASGDQPIYNESRNKCIVFNGEIYNYRPLRTELIAKGHIFHTTSDTEVIIHLYEEYGELCVNRLRGMFAFAIANGSTLFIARDRLGIKPLYYAHLRNTGLLIFASEIKALLQCRELRTAVDRQALADYLVVGHAFGNETFLEGIKCLEPGHYMLVSMQTDAIEIEEREYWRLSVDPDDSLDYKKSEEALTALLEDSVQSHLVADVEIGLTLSGGVDSSLLAMLMKKYHPDRISTFTVSDVNSNPDIKQSKVIADRIEAAHTEVLLEFDDYLRAIPHCVLAAEVPVDLIGLPFFILCAQIGKRLKVCLNGEGADELFGGYPDYFDCTGPLASLKDGLAEAIRLNLSPGYGVISLVENLSSITNNDEYLRRLFLVNLQDQLIRRHLEIVDKLSMASSVEMRVPFLDNELVEFVNRLPLCFKVNRDLGVGKYILKRAALNLFGDAMTDAVVRRKIGMPSASLNYFPKFTDLCEANLPNDYIEKHELGNYFLGIRKGSRRYAKRSLLLFDLFCFIFIDQRGAVPEDFDIREFIKTRSFAMT